MNQEQPPAEGPVSSPPYEIVILAVFIVIGLAVLAVIMVQGPRRETKIRTARKAFAPEEIRDRCVTVWGEENRLLLMPLLLMV